MKSEMNKMDLLRTSRGPLRTSPGPKAGGAIEPQYGKIDGTPVKEGATNRVASNSIVERPAFKKIMKAVATANKNAAATPNGRSGVRPRKSGEAAESPETKDQPNGQYLRAEGVLTIETLKLESALAFAGTQSPESAIDVSGENGEAGSVSDASALLQKAIETISKALNLKIDPGLETVRIDNPAPAVKDLLAEMLIALQGILGLLEDAVKSDLPVDMGNKMLDASQAAVLEKTLRVEVFHIEIALSMVENGRDIAALVAKKSNRPADSGLIQAMDPSAIAMPASHLKQVLSGDLFSDGRRIETLFANLAQLLREQMASGKRPITESALELKSITHEATVTGIQVSGIGKKAPEVGEFDNQVMRMLLKIDKIEAGNKEAALQNETFDLSKITGALFAKKPGEMAGLQNDKIDAVFHGVFAGKDQSGLGFIDQLKLPTLPKTVEESVMNQLAGKLQEAVKTGVTEIRLLLRPESLGEMRVKLTIDGDVVMGKIYVENQQVKHIIETNMQSLKDSLAQHNLQTGSFDVNVGGQGREQLDELANRHLSHPGKRDEELSDALGSTDPSAAGSIGGETGRRFGSNTIEYFA